MINIKTGKEVSTTPKVDREAILAETELKRLLTQAIPSRLATSLDIIETTIYQTLVETEEDYQNYLLKLKGDTYTVTTTEFITETVDVITTELVEETIFNDITQEDEKIFIEKEVITQEEQTREVEVNTEVEVPEFTLTTKFSVNLTSNYTKEELDYFESIINNIKELIYNLELLSNTNIFDTTLIL